MTSKTPTPLLDTIQYPQDLRALKADKLRQVSDELRNCVLQCVSETGGHLSSGLGTVELTVALHYVFDTPNDRLVWDVGHQSYPHKILTGRRDQMPSLRQKGGLSGFPNREESAYDTFGVGHSSTSISAALGMAVAAKQTGDARHVAAIIGDGALTAGMAFEALNHAGDLDANLLVILNDNDMSISPNVGAMSNYFARVLSSKVYAGMKEGSKKVLSAMPSVWELARRTEEHMKGMVVPGTLFEELGFNYIGPIDGHDIDTLVATLTNLRNLKGPQFLHIVTKKGKGYLPAEENPCTYHGVGQFDIKSGKLASKPTNGPSYTQIFSDWICDMAEQDPKLAAVTPAMREGSGLVDFAKRFPERYFDVGIAEQHAVTFAAGLACEGVHPVVAIYSTFLQRGYDQLIHDVALQNLPVLFAIDRAGIVGPDGATHAGTFDLSYLRCIPNMVIMAAADENECRQMLYTGYQHSGPCAVRYPRGTGMGVKVEKQMTAIPMGKAQTVRKGESIAILSFGSLLSSATAAADVLNASLTNMRFIKPLDEKMILKLADSHQLLVTIEDNTVMGGAGSAVNECLLAHHRNIPVLNLGLPDEFQAHGSRDEVLSEAKLSSSDIIAQIEHFFKHQHYEKHLSLAK
ncbi:1-deoxy-D-xylulose 5-phosphate synthase [hydrothermal vent metagenome]|uniref:1-deoxy-D-xylulose-5-phosphate synthase n=1 Tax=hydrothermal vent metagenome TaxID=652676 RepID=A0A3B0ZNL8_9ZZZZ